MLLETSAQVIGVLDMQNIYEYITKVKNMLYHKLQKQTWNIGFKVQKTNNSKISSYLVSRLTIFWNGLKNEK